MVWWRLGVKTWSVTPVDATSSLEAISCTLPQILAILILPVKIKPYIYTWADDDGTIGVRFFLKMLWSSIWWSIFLHRFGGYLLGTYWL